MQIVLFIITSLIVIVTPGQDMVLVMSRSVAQGSRAGIATAAGVSTGLLGHTVLAAMGLGAVLQTSELLFTCIKMMGAVYLGYLGAKLLLSKKEEFQLSSGGGASLAKVFFEGAVSNMSNPKIAIFYFAFLPQFVPAGNNRPALMLLVLGVSFSVLTFFVKAPIGFGAGTLSKWLRSRPSVQLWINRFSGCVLVALGIKLALENRA